MIHGEELGIDYLTASETLALQISLCGVLRAKLYPLEPTPLQREAQTLLIAQKGRLWNDQLFDIAARANWIEGHPPTHNTPIIPPEKEIPH